MIEFINSLSNNDLKASGIGERIELIPNVSRVLEKRELLRSLKKKIDDTKETIDKFKEQFRLIQNFGLPFPWKTDPWLHPEQTYLDILIACRDDMEFAKGKNEVISGKVIVNSLEQDFSILILLT